MDFLLLKIFCNFIKIKSRQNMKIYLDYASTSPVDPKVFFAMKPYLNGQSFGNPSSFHLFGQEAKKAVDDSREIIADFFGCLPEEIIFTGSATEANNTVIFGSIKPFTHLSLKPHLITTEFEHKSVFMPYKELESVGAEVTYLPTTKEGFVKISDVKKALKKNTVLVSIMYANNEIGAIQPIAEIGKLIKSVSQKQKSKIYFHTDAVQAIQYLDCDVKKLCVDFLTFSGHKIYGPKGVGGFYKRKGVPLIPLIYGGGQEKNLRAGTENVSFVVGLGEAITQVVQNKQKISQIINLKKRLINGIIKVVPSAKLNGIVKDYLPNIINFSFKGVEGEAIGLALSQQGIAVSTGSACESQDLKPSRSLIALGLKPEDTHGSIRISIGRFTTEKEVDKFLKVFPIIIARLRKISGYKIIANKQLTTNN